MDVQYIARLVAERVFEQQSAQLLASRTFRSPSSLMHRLEFAIGGASKCVFVKLPGETGPRYEILANRLRREYEVMKSVRMAIPETPEMRMAVPAGFIGEVNGLVTWEILGESLQDMISTTLRLPSASKVAHLAQLCDLAGQWLRQFHCLDLAQREEDLRESLTDYYEGRLERLVRIADSNVPADLAQSLGRKIQTWIDEALDDTSAKVVLCHNDYSPHNVIVTGTQICVLDFSYAAAGLPAFDIACFWHKLEDLKSSPLHSSRAVEALQARFLDGYGGSFDLTRPEAKLGIARLVLSKMLTLLSDRSVRPDRWIERKWRYSRYLTLLRSDLDPTRL